MEIDFKADGPVTLVLDSSDFNKNQINGNKNQNDKL